MIQTLYIKLIAVAVVATVTIGAVQYVRGLKSDLEKCSTEKIQLETAIGLQNDAIEVLRKEGEERLQKAQQDLDAAKKEAEKNKNAARVIYRATPSTPGDSCKSALDLVNGGAQ